MKKIVYLVVLIIILFVVFVGGYKYLNPNTDNGMEISEPNPEDVVNLGEGVVAEMIDSVVSTSTLEKMNMATLDRPIVFSGTGLVEVFKKNEEQIKSIVSGLKVKPGVFSDWNDLGIYRKMIEDYIGAKEAWENASILNPKSALPLSNLGNLYGYYMKDGKTAEKYYLASIEAEPNYGFWYYQTFLFYKEVLNDKAKAKDIIEKGIENNPIDEDLKNILNSL